MNKEQIHQSELIPEAQKALLLSARQTSEEVVALIETVGCSLRNQREKQIPC
jgi:hypothetical protein